MSIADGSVPSASEDDFVEAEGKERDCAFGVMWRVRWSVPFVFDDDAEVEGEREEEARREEEAMKRIGEVGVSIRLTGDRVEDVESEDAEGGRRGNGILRWRSVKFRCGENEKVLARNRGEDGSGLRRCSLLSRGRRLKEGARLIHVLRRVSDREFYRASCTYPT